MKTRRSSQRRSSQRRSSQRRTAVTLLELVVTLSLMGLVVAAIATLVRTSTATWTAVDSDHVRLSSAHGVLRHFIRSARQAYAVTAITAPDTAHGAITLQSPAGDERVWSCDGVAAYVTSAGSSPSLLAESVTHMSFLGLEKDGVTPAQAVADIRAVQMTITVGMDREVDGERTVRATAWLRTKP